MRTKPTSLVSEQMPPSLLHLAHRIVVWSCVLIAAIAFSPIAIAAPPAADNGTKAQQSLDDALLEDIDTGLPEYPADKPRADDGDRMPDAADNPPAKEPGRRSLDEELLDGLEGEDIGHGPANENPLVRLNQRMKQVERRIAETRSDETTQRLQQEIADDLSKLIEQLQQQCRQSKNPSPSPRQQQTTSAKPANKPSERPGDQPARDSTPHTKNRDTAKVAGPRLQERLKDVWGHLPPHLRQQMEQSANEEFLPKYETEISEYYRSLVGGGKGRK